MEKNGIISATFPQWKKQYFEKDGFPLMEKFYEKINVSIRKLNITKKGKFSPFGHEYYFFRDIQARITDNAISVTDDFCFTLTINAKKIIEWAGDFIIVLI